jgi:Tol biopolymer transport system component
MRIVAAVLAGVLVAMSTPAAATAAYPSAAITFIRDGDVWLQKGPMAYGLTESGGASWPHLSPDGREIAFVYGGDIWIAGVIPGKPILRLTKGANAGGPSWSPDGKWIAYRSGDTHVGILYRVAAQATEEVWPAHAVPEEWSVLQRANTVAWSPDGRYIAFPGGDCWTINDDCLTLFEVKTGNEHTAASFGGGGVEASGFATTPAWGKDSRYLYFTQQTGLREEGPVQVMEFDRVSSRLRQIGADGDSMPAPLREGGFVVCSGSELIYLHADGRRFLLGPGTQPNAAY